VAWSRLREDVGDEVCGHPCCSESVDSDSTGTTSHRPGRSAATPPRRGSAAAESGQPVLVRPEPVDLELLARLDRVGGAQRRGYDHLPLGGDGGPHRGEIALTPWFSRSAVARAAGRRVAT
jgi:hypothetical protein